MDLLHQITIDLFGLGLDEVVGDWFFILDIFCNDQSEFITASSEKGGIDHCCNTACFSMDNIRRKGMNLLLNPLAGMTIFLAQLR